MISRLYNEALEAFKTQMLQELKPGKEHELLENFLATREAPQRAADEARALKSQTDRKWSDRKIGKVTVPAHWIDKIMENIQNFISIGNTVMEGAPESAGLAWLAVRLTLSAIQGNYELYTLFGTGLTDITEIMVLIPHYDQLYDDDSRKLQKGDSLVGMLFNNITEAYIAVLRFSFEIKRHISASPLKRATHVVADFFGSSKLKFQDLLDKIKTRKSRVLEYSMATYQDKSLKFNERQEADMELLKNTLEDMQNFHDSEKKYREEFIAEIHAMKQTIETSTKPKTPWDFAVVNFEKTKKRLNPEDNIQELLAAALDKRFVGTCQWVLEDKDFLKWYQAQSNELLYVTGGKGTGKSTLLGFIVEHLCDNMEKDNTIPIYFSCEATTKAKTICNTLLYQIYSHAKNEDNNAPLLEACNAVFSHSKSADFTKARGNDAGAKARGGVANIIGNDDALIDFSVAMPKLSTQLKRSVVAIIDGVDSLPAEEQKYLIDQIQAVLTVAHEGEPSGVHIKILVGCRVPLRSAYSELNLESYNHDDMRIPLSAALKSLQGIPSEDLEKATDTILKKAGPSFSYVIEIGIPFIRQPFQGPLDKRLNLLPEPKEMSSTYSEAIENMEQNYLDLLRVAVTWCLLAPEGELTVEVVMDVFRGIYQSQDLGNEVQIEHVNASATEGTTDVSENRNDTDDVKVGNHEPSKEEDGANDDASSDESMDEEDYEQEASESGNEEDQDPIPEYSPRHEINFWPYHLHEAENRWSEEDREGNEKWSEIFTQLDRLCENTIVFNAWQKIYNYREMNDFFKSPKNPLHVASFLSLTSWAKRLLDRGQDPNELSGSFNALQAATMRSSTPNMLRLLLERGGDINSESELVRPAFYSCLSQKPGVETIKLMLEHGADPLIRDKFAGWTALHYFAQVGEDPEALKLLLNHPSIRTDGEYINSKTRDKDTPLHILLRRSEVPTELLTAFLDNGANVNEDDNFSMRPLQLASIWGELECLQILLRNTTLINDDDNYGNTALHFAALCGYAKCVDLLIEKGADPNRVNKPGRTPVHQAAWSAEKDCVQHLLQHGADLNPADTHNRTPLFYACQASSQETAVLILETLLERKVPISEINKITKGLRTPLRQAASAGFDKVVQILIAGAKADSDTAALHLDQRDTRHGMTPLHRASWNGHNECVRALLQAGVDFKIPVKDQEGRTALVLACEKWALSHQGAYEDVIFQLIEKDPLAAKGDAELLSLCAAHGSLRIIQQLREIGADFSVRDRYGWTPLELARQFQRDKVERILKQQTAWKGLLPSRWERRNLKDTISEDGLNITHANWSRLCVTTDRPIPAGLDNFYFEITPEPLNTRVVLKYSEVAIGFCTLRGGAIEFPGWPPRDQVNPAASWGYHGDNGGFYCSTREGFVDSSLRYGIGDTVGCGVNLTTGKVWFTKNGELLKYSFQDAHGRLFPVVGLRQPIRFSTNFVGPFKWNGDAENDQRSADAPEAFNVLSQMQSKPYSVVDGVQLEANSAMLEAASARRRAKSRGAKLLQEPMPGLRGSIPAKDICDQAIDGYLRTFEPMFRVLHVPSFMREYDRYWTQTELVQNGFLMKLTMVLTIGAIFLTDRSVANDIKRTARNWVYTVQWWLTGPTERDAMSIDGVQVFCLLLLARQASALGGTASIMTEALSKLSFTIGLHIDPRFHTSATPFESELRRRLWLTVLELTTITSLNSTLPLLLYAGDYEVPLPSNIADSKLGKPDKSETSREPCIKHEELDCSLQIMLAKSLRLRMQIVRELNDQSREASHEKATSLSNNLQTHCRELAAYFQPSGQDTPLARGFHEKFLDTYFRRLILFLHRPFAQQARREARYLVSRKTCLDSSLIMASHTEAMDLPGGALDDFSCCCISGSGMFKGALGQDVILGVSLEIVTQLEEEGLDDSRRACARMDPLALLARSYRKPLMQYLRHVREQWKQVILLGRPSLKQYLFGSCILAQIEAMEAGRDVKPAILETIRRCLRECTGFLRESPAYGSAGGCHV
ncbi:hypothetical protein GQX73_g7098 [Xylaria multiplex]|uniref:B30.2/SPRY domain-containing protein n=1 Tax=Xylaria multiplex TaxID=323545 RepID=A0A7C8MQV1_9PEZI|nr:hypothetical protein GQX73_g7098 [Xylaria multiplex]